MRVRVDGTLPRSVAAIAQGRHSPASRSLQIKTIRDRITAGMVVRHEAPRFLSIFPIAKIPVSLPVRAFGECREVSR
jgi:hypothetical protein